ncbi:hypothetical protein [Sinomonas sp. P47F7]|uniref:hypothetical protein n=1 Tax=Sinomonas sp. P47F7 TaxID=3410987 RepID=UPI003BF5A63D
MELREYKGADSNPPRLEIDGSTVQPAIIDWKSPAAKELLKDDSKELSKFPVLKIGESLDIEISSPLEPAALELSVFRGSMNEIDPAGPPDHIVDMLASDLVSRTTSSGTLVYSLDRTAAGIAGHVVIGVFSQYYADPSLSQERFTNSVGWVFSLETTGN